MAGLGAKDLLRNVTVLEQLIEEINFQRAKEMRQCLMSKDSGISDGGFAMVQGATYWTDLFVRHFLFETDRSTDADDLLFFIRKKQVKGSRYIPKYQTEVEVYRKDSRKLPIGDPDIDWEETVYLNLIIHQFDYTLTLAVCTRTSPKELQVLKRHSQKVYASPSRRRMDTKGDVEEITYPNVCFHVDNFDEIFADMLVRDGEMVCVELVASDHIGTHQSVIFLGSIRYDALKKVYDARASLSSKMAQRMMLSLFSGSGAQRIEFVRMKGPQGKGHAEMAVTKPKGSGAETPTSEPGISLTDMWDSDWEDEPEDMFIYRHQRRLSDPSANFNTFINSGWKRGEGGGRSRSENEGLDNFADGLYEIESGDVRDAVCSGRCCSVVACTSVRVTKDSPPPEALCTKCQHFHGNIDEVTPAEKCSPNLEDSLETEENVALLHKNSPITDNRSHQSCHSDKKSLHSHNEDANDNKMCPNDTDNISNKHIDNSNVSPVHNSDNQNITDDLENDNEQINRLIEPNSNKKEAEEEEDVFYQSVSSLDELGKFPPEDEAPCINSNELEEKSSSPDILDDYEVVFSSDLKPKKCKPGVAVRVESKVHPLKSINEDEFKPSCSKNNDSDEESEPDENIPLLSGEPVTTTQPRRSSKNNTENHSNTMQYETKRKKDKKIVIPYRMTPEGTKVNFLCDIKLDDGAYNQLWSTRGFTQTYHFWKENRRAQSVPLNAYLTYVTLPWFTIITDILDHRTGPILTF